MSFSFLLILCGIKSQVQPTFIYSIYWYEINILVRRIKYSDGINLIGSIRQSRPIITTLTTNY